MNRAAPYTGFETDPWGSEGSISFLKKRNKKLLLCRLMRLTGTEANKSFLVLFFKNELLPWRLAFLHPWREQEHVSLSS
jgi:hypothetical protein